MSNNIYQSYLRKTIEDCSINQKKTTNIPKPEKNVIQISLAMLNNKNILIMINSLTGLY